MSTTKPNLSEPGSILVDGFDTRIIPRSFSRGTQTVERNANSRVFLTSVSLFFTCWFFENICVHRARLSHDSRAERKSLHKKYTLFSEALKTHEEHIYTHEEHIYSQKPLEIKDTNSRAERKCLHKKYKCIFWSPVAVCCDLLRCVAVTYLEAISGALKSECCTNFDRVFTRSRQCWDVKNMLKETYKYQKRDLQISKETYMYQKRDLHISKETHI